MDFVEFDVKLEGARLNPTADRDHRDASLASMDSTELQKPAENRGHSLELHFISFRPPIKLL